MNKIYNPLKINILETLAQEKLKQKRRLQKKGTQENKRRAARYLRLINRWLPMALLIIVITHIVASFHTQRFATVNITGIVNNFIETHAKSGLSNDELRKNVQIFGKALEKTMYEVAIKKNAVLFPAEAVITGAQDYTEEVQKHLPIPKHHAETEQKQRIQQKQNEQPILSQERIVEDDVFSMNQLNQSETE